MTQKDSKSLFVWLIIGLCVISLPVGIFANNFRPAGQDDTIGSAFGMSMVDRILVIKITGMIMENDRDSILSIARAPTSTVRKIRKAAKNDRIKAVLLRINSPGGTIGASQELNEAVKDLRKKKPIVTSMGDIAASGGYYVACATDKIFANPGTLTGSIGVIISMMNIKGLAEKIGIAPKIVKSGPFKDITSMYRPMTDEERKILQDLIDDSYEQFVEAVSSGRKMKVEEVKKVADGRIYSGRQALKNGLVDKLGTQEDALAELQKMCRKKYALAEDLPVDYGSSDSLFDLLFESADSLMGRQRASSAEVSLLEKLLPVSIDAKYYNQPLWLMQ